MLCGGGKEGDFLSEDTMGLQADVTETSQNPIQARTLDCFLSLWYFMRVNPHDAKQQKKGLTATRFSQI